MRSLNVIRWLTVYFSEWGKHWESLQKRFFKKQCWNNCWRRTIFNASISKDAPIRFSPSSDSLICDSEQTPGLFFSYCYCCCCCCCGCRVVVLCLRLHEAESRRSLVVSTSESADVGSLCLDSRRFSVSLAGFELFEQWFRENLLLVAFQRNLVTVNKM